MAHQFTLDPQFLALVKEALDGLSYFKNVFAYDTVSSTNDIAHSLEQTGSPQGTVVVAKVQAQGRGRLQRNWVTEKGDIAVSIVIRPPYLPCNMALLPMLPALSMVDALHKLSVDIRLKWPNDLVIKSKDGVRHDYLGEYRKIGGVLIENVFRQEQIAASIIGVGLNIISKEHVLNKVPYIASLQDYAPSIAYLPCLKQFLQCFERRLQFLCDSPDQETIINEYVAHCETIGRKVSVHGASGLVCGYTIGIREDGALLVDDGKKIHVVRAGDVVSY